MKLKLYFALPFILQATIWRILMRPFFYLFFGLKVRGLENLQGLPKGVIFAPNHSSELDSVLLPLALPLWSRFSPMFYIVREPKFYTDPVFKWRRHFYDLLPFRSLGAHPIVSGVRDYAVSLATHVNILKDGGSVCIFPEGSFTKDGSIGAGHGGVSYLSHMTSRAVIPVLIDGTHKMELSDLLLFRRKITLTFLPPVYAHQALPAEPSIEQYKDFADRILDILRRERAQMHATQLQHMNTHTPVTKAQKLTKI